MKYFVLILICAAINSLDDTNEEYRKYYGLSFHSNCGNYFITFKCMTACKSLGFEVFRLDYECKCSCHELKTTTILPAFVWRTNGTMKTVPATYSPKLYAIIGTMSPPPLKTSTDYNVTASTNQTTIKLTSSSTAITSTQSSDLVTGSTMNAGTANTHTATTLQN